MNFKVVSKLVAKVMGIVLQTNGVTKANVKILVLISELAVRAHSVQCQITMHCVLVLLAWLEIQELNVYEMLTSAYQTHVVLMPGKNFFNCHSLIDILCTVSIERKKNRDRRVILRG